MGPVNRRDTGDLTGPNPLHPIRPAAVGKPGLVPGGPEGTSSGQTIIVDWALGNICNQACWYCPPGLRNGSHGWQSARQVASALREIANHYRHGFEMDVWVSFTGGEPTLHPQFGQLADFARQLGLQVNVVSNASRTLHFWHSVAPSLTSAVLSYHHAATDLEHFVGVARMLGHALPLRIDVPAPPEAFDDITDAARVLSARVPSCDVVLRPLRKTDGTLVGAYTSEQLDRMSDPSQVETGPGARAHASAPGGDWRGHICEAGVRSLRVEADGTVKRVACGVGGALGHISRPLRLPVSAVLCDIRQCRYPEDIAVPKRLPEPPGHA